MNSKTFSEEDDGLIQAVELALDYGLDIPDEDVDKYFQLINQNKEERING